MRITMTTLLSVSIAVMAGIILTRPFKRFGFPDVTIFLVTGILIGPYCLGRLGIEGLGFVDMEAVASLALLSDVALGFIAFSIGSEFRLSELRHTGRQALIVGVFQAFVATVMVDIALLGLHLLIPDKLTAAQAIILGAIASATAPAATLMVVRQYKASGPLTDLLLPVVALDDAVGLIIFSVSFGIAKNLVTGQSDLLSIFVTPLLEIVFSLLLGALLGVILTRVEKIFHSNTNRLSLVIAFILCTVALSMLEFHIGPFHVAFSPLLVCMMLGTVFCNMCPLSEEMMDMSERWTAPLLALFFVLSGAELELGVFSDIIIVGIGIVYIIFRSAGKYLGAFASGKASGCTPPVCKYLGITLLPQAGVALGMSITAKQIGEQGDLIRNIVLFSVLIYELVGPTLTKWALTKVGEITPVPDHIKNRRANKIAAVGGDVKK
ncbi:MAG: cation:proton antiporter [Oscillospiraceae bacterium]|nr:cation:proton antiporter [Oscillospiraceae bacterium]